MADPTSPEAELPDGRPSLADAPTVDLIDFALQQIVQRKRLLEIVVKALDGCAGKALQDRYLVDILTQSVEGAVVQICSAAEWVLKLLRHVRAGRLRDFTRGARADLSVAGASVAESACLDAFTELFPAAKLRGADGPNAADVEALEAQVRQILAPVRTHRDKLLAHWDAGTQVPATWGDLTNALLALERLLTRMWVVHTRSTYLVEAKSPHSRGSTAELLSQAILR